MIEIINIDKEIKGNKILSDISMSISKGSCVGFVGHNGSGKTMLLKSICGFISIDKGQILIDNDKIIYGKNYIKNAGIIIEQPEFLNHLSAIDNLTVLANIQKIIGKEDILNTLKKVGLSHAKDKKVKHYSLGMKQRLRIAQAIMEDPQILILDEPFNGLDKDAVGDFQNIILEYKAKGVTIILTSHDERQIKILCDKVYEFNGGEVT